jgi:hypothetical protein
VLPDGLDQFPQRKVLNTVILTIVNGAEVYTDYVEELKMLGIISVTNLNDLQTHIFLFSTLISFFKEHSVYLLQSKILA